MKPLAIRMCKRRLPSSRERLSFLILTLHIKEQKGIRFYNSDLYRNDFRAGDARSSSFSERV